MIFVIQYLTLLESLKWNKWVVTATKLLLAIHPYPHVEYDTSIHLIPHFPLPKNYMIFVKRKALKEPWKPLQI